MKISNNLYLCLVLIILIISIVIVLTFSDKIVKYTKENFSDLEISEESEDETEMIEKSKCPKIEQNKNNTSLTTPSQEGCKYNTYNEFLDTIKCNTCGKNDLDQDQYTINKGEKCKTLNEIDNMNNKDVRINYKQLLVEHKNILNENNKLVKENNNSHEYLVNKSENKLVNRFKEVQQTNREIERINRDIQSNLLMLKEKKGETYM